MTGQKQSPIFSASATTSLKPQDKSLTLVQQSLRLFRQNIPSPRILYLSELGARNKFKPFNVQLLF
jgi:hypothetical protein